MKNIHILPTDKPSRLHFHSELFISKKIQLSKGINSIVDGINIYITSDEEIKEGDWVYYLHNSGLHKPRIMEVIKPNYSDYKPYSIHFKSGFGVQEDCKKIILTTDQDLIKYGVQVIDDEFLEWFVKNPSCEEVKVEKWFDTSHISLGIGKVYHNNPNIPLYKIIIPKEEPKTAWVGVLHDKLNEYYPAEYELKDIYQGEGCLPNFPNEELCQIWCDSKYKVEPKPFKDMKELIEVDFEKLNKSLKKGIEDKKEPTDFSRIVSQEFFNLMDLKEQPK